MSVVDKDISSKQKRLGQFLTPQHIVDFCIGKIDIKYGIVIEPSCGSGAFLDALRKESPKGCNILGIEIDDDLVKEYHGPEEILICNFYDFDERIGGDVAFVGNPPFRTPAVSLRSHKEYITKLMADYGIRGIKEEAVFFLVRTVDLIRQSGAKGSLHYILPKSIFQNNSSSYKTFLAFLEKHTKLLQVWDIEEFPGVDQKLVFVSMEVTDRGQDGDHFVMNGKFMSVDQFYGNAEDYITFREIFKKTYLGSVPCESLFLSIAGEPIQQFRDRLFNLFDLSTVVDEDNLVGLLSYNGKQHIRSLRTGSHKKIVQLLKYIEQTKELTGFDPSLFGDLQFYKSIQHRNEPRFYFRHEFLKKAPYIYIINSNPCPSFYFPGNPSANSTDYFGFCEYDVNRNSGPGANRCVPIDGIGENLYDDFRTYWNENTSGRPYYEVFMYILYLSKSDWYKDMKKKYHRFYFGIPRTFDVSYLSCSTKLPEILDKYRRKK